MEGLELDRSSLFCRLIHGFDDAHIRLPLETGRLGLFVRQNALGEVNDFGGELIARGKRF